MSGLRFFLSLSQEESPIFRFNPLYKDKVTFCNCLNMQMFYYRKADIRYYRIVTKLRHHKLKLRNPELQNLKLLPLKTEAGLCTGRLEGRLSTRLTLIVIRRMKTYYSACSLSCKITEDIDNETCKRWN